MGEKFEQCRKTLAVGAPKGLIWDSAHYPDEDHGSTVLRAHYAGLRTIFSDWQVPRDENGLPGGGLVGLQQHFQKLSERFGYRIPVPEKTMNNLAYQLIAPNKLAQATPLFTTNIEL